MTTIAYKDGVLAADTLATSNCLRDNYGTKIWRVGKLLVAASGNKACCLRFRTWVADGMEGESPFEGADLGNGLVIAPDGNIVCWGENGPWPVTVPFYTLGSGYQLALGALAAGASAIEAVKIAAEYDTHTGGEVESLTLEREKPEPPPIRTEARGVKFPFVPVIVA
jgi:hypothetical protein